MKLYHGTAARHLDSVLSHGLRPRGRKAGNWREYPSRRDMVYMTTAYAPYFAMQSLGKKDMTLLLVEVESDRLDETLLHPDEDFVAQAIAHQKNRPISDFHDEVRRSLEFYRHHWKDSVSGLGNAAYKGTIPADAITRLCTVDLTRQSDLMIVCDPTISIINYHLCGERYRSIIAWLFGDREEFLLGHGPNEWHIAMMSQHDPSYADRVAGLFSNRDGIEVLQPQVA